MLYRLIGAALLLFSLLALMPCILSAQISRAEERGGWQRIPAPGPDDDDEKGV